MIVLRIGLVEVKGLAEVAGEVGSREQHIWATYQPPTGIKLLNWDLYGCKS